MEKNDNFQSRSTKIGREFREECKKLLESLGFVFNGEQVPIEDYGVEIELIYNNKHDISLFFEAAGTIEYEPASPRPGLERTDTVKKIIGNAYLVHLSTGTPTIVLTSHPPDADKASRKMLEKVPREVIFDVINIYNKEDIKKLKLYLISDSDDLEQIRTHGSPFEFPWQYFKNKYPKVFREISKNF